MVCCLLFQVLVRSFTLALSCPLASCHLPFLRSDDLRLYRSQPRWGVVFLTRLLTQTISRSILYSVGLTRQVLSRGVGQGRVLLGGVRADPYLCLLSFVFCNTAVELLCATLPVLQVACSVCL